MTDEHKQRIRNAVCAVVERKEYPSVPRVAKQLGRFSRSMNNDEKRYRAEVMLALGIKVSHRGPGITLSGSKPYAN